MLKHYLNIAWLLVYCLVLTIFYKDHSWFLPALITGISVFLVLLSLGILFLRYQYFLKAQIKTNTSKVLLTFDDGPDEKYTQIILGILKKYNIAAIFFVIGKKAKSHSEIVKQAVNEGHLIANHTENHHPLFSMMSGAKVLSEIIQGEDAIATITGTNLKLFRPPIGYTNPIIARAVRKSNQKVVGWSLRSYDSVFSGDKLLNRLLSKQKPGDIVLLHDNLPQTVEVLDEYIKRSLENGIIFVSKEEIQSIC